MSLDNIQLPAIVVQNLFKNSLFNLKTHDVDIDMSANTTITFLGNNEKKIVILVNNSEAIYLPDDVLNFLMNILKACNLSMTDIALVNLSKNSPLSYLTINNQFKAEKIILFGIDPVELDLPLQFPFYQVQQYNKQVYLTAPDLTEIQKDKTEKTKLWNCLKQLFEYLN